MNIMSTFRPEEGICLTKQTLKVRGNSHWTEMRRYRMDREMVGGKKGKKKKRKKKEKKKSSEEAKIQ